jgi:hypothetical protein
MILQQLLARTSVTAIVDGAKLDLPPSVEPGDLIALVLVGGYNANVEFANAQTGAPKLPIGDDTGVAPVAPVTIWVGPAKYALIWCFGASVAIEIMVFAVRQ